jgi:hypothetical protein
MTDGERQHVVGGTIVGVSVALLPLRPGVATWLLSPESAFTELRLAIRLVRVVAWPELTLFLVGAAGGTALALEVAAIRRRCRPSASAAALSGAVIDQSV